MEVPVEAPRFSLVSTRISVRSALAFQFVDITDAVQNLVRDSGVDSGILLVASRHTTASVVVNEHEPELLKDMSRMLHEMAPRSNGYRHDLVPCAPGERPNGHAHCQALLLSSSAQVPVSAGRAALGRYQRIFLVELDGPRDRTLSVTIIGA